MRLAALLLCFMFSGIMCLAQEGTEKAKEIKKEIIIIKTDDKEVKNKEEILIRELKDIEGLEDIEKLIARLTNSGGDSIDVDLDVEIENGTTIKKYVIKSTENGKEEVREIIEKTTDDSKEKSIAKTKQKRIIILDTEDDKLKNGSAIKRDVHSSDTEEITVIVRGMESEDNDSIQVNVELEDNIKAGQRKVIVKTIKDGKEEVREIIEDFSSDDMDSNTFILEMEDSETSMPKPSVSMGVMIANGTLIDKVVEGSSAEIAGLKKGDKLIKIDNQIIYSINGLLEHLCSYKASDKAKVTIQRDGETLVKEIVFKAKE